MTILEAIKMFFVEKTEVSMGDLYAAMPDTLPHSIRARIYENLGEHFRRIGRDLYVAVKGDATCLVAKADAWDSLKPVPSESVDCLITDPPYPWLDAVLKIHTTTRPRMRWTFEKREIDRELGLDIYRVLKRGAHAFFFVPAESAATRPHIERFIRLMESCGFVFNKRWIWYKISPGMGYNGRASYEGILFMSKGSRRKPCDLSVPDVLSCRSIDHRRRKHPCEKPEGLLERIISFATKAGELVLDLFAGSCAVGLTAVRMGRHALCIEKDPAALARALTLAPDGIA